MDRATHWNDVHSTRSADSVSWFQAQPLPSLQMIEAAGLNPTARVLDVGGGASSLVDALLDRGYAHVGLLDVAAEALEAVRARLGRRAERVEWFDEDVLSFATPHPWELWHDRAVFHFLTDRADQDRYRRVLLDSLAPEGQAVIAPFGPDGPERCSGLPVQRYDAARLAAALGPELRLVEHRLEVHTTPSGADQQFLFARFVRA